MDEQELRSLIDKVKIGSMSRRGFAKRLMAVGLTAPMATQLLAFSGVAMAQPGGTKMDVRTADNIGFDPGGAASPAPR